MHGVKNTEIAIKLGLCERDSDPDIKVKATDIIRRYLEARWRFALKTAEIRYSIKNLAIYLKTHFLNNDAYTKFLSKDDE